MMNELSTERAIGALYTVRAYYASLTAGYPKGKDRRGIGDVMCSEIANSCLMAIKALEQQPSDDCVSREDGINKIEEWADGFEDGEYFSGKSVADAIRACGGIIAELPSVTPKTRWIPVSENGDEDNGEI